MNFRLKSAKNLEQKKEEETIHLEYTDDTVYG